MELQSAIAYYVVFAKDRGLTSEIKGSYKKKVISDIRSETRLVANESSILQGI